MGIASPATMKWSSWKYRQQPSFTPVPTDDGDATPLKSRSKKWIISLALISAANIILLFFNLNIWVQTGRVSSIPISSSFRTVPRTFEEALEYFPDRPDDPWDELTSPNVGFVGIANPDKWGLPASFPIPNGNKQLYGISMTHQLHCLLNIKEALQNRTSMTSERYDIKGSPMYHIGHCVDYLRQSILCAGDLTLEKTMLVEGSGLPMAVGIGDVHQCRDLSEFYRLLEEHDPLADLID